MPESNYKLRTLSRALDVLELIEASHEPMSLTEIANTMKEATPIIYRILRTFEARGYLHRRPRDKRYQHTGHTTGTGSVRRAIDILRAVAEFSPNGCTPFELSERTGLDEEIIDELLKPLVGKALVKPANDTGRFQLSYSLLEITRFLLKHDDLTSYIRPLMKRLRDETGETVSLYKRVETRQVIIAVVPSLHPVRYALDVGASFPLHLGAAGKVNLALIPNKELHRLLYGGELTQLTDHVPDVKALELELKQIRTQGYALSSGERVQGASAVATAIQDDSGQVLAVLSFMMPTYRTTPDKMNAFGAMLVKEIKALYLPSKIEE